jgi:hypothetical protein
MTNNVIVSLPDQFNRATVIKLPDGVEDGPFVTVGKEVFIREGAGEPGTYYNQSVYRIDFEDIEGTVAGNATHSED